MTHEEIKQATHEELLNEWGKCDELWSKYSCDCLGFYIEELHSAIVKKGGWPVR